ncbi:MAG: dephospho-CoA kinase [Acutalibacteraceae bacterium]
MIIGLTGQTGSGKSTLCNILEKNGFYICSCDDIAKEVRSDAKTALKIADVFGYDIIEENGQIDKRLLAQRAFKDKKSAEKLNEIMHPAIISLAFERINNALKSGFVYAVLDAPQLFESGAEKDCDFIVSVIADKEERLRRILLRDGISREEALSRIAVQHDDSFYIEKSDYVIVNDEYGALEEKAEALIRALKDYKPS